MESANRSIHTGAQALARRIRRSTGPLDLRAQAILRAVIEEYVTTAAPVGSHALVDRYLTTIPKTDRMAVAGQIVHHITDQLLTLPLYYPVTSTMIAHRLKNVPSRVPTDGTVTWNAPEWDVQGAP